MQKPSLSIVIPAFNEVGRIPSTIDAVWNHLAGTNAQCEIIVVDDGSSDGTGEFVRGLQPRYPGLYCIENEKNRGKGFSVRRGFLEARGELVLITDADLATPVEEWRKLRVEIERGADIAIGSRGLPESRITKHQPVYRELMGKTFNRIVRLVAVRGIRDTQCGFKLFRRKACARLFKAQRVDRFAFDVELLFLAQKVRLKIAEIPVEWRNSPYSKVGIIRDSSRMLFDVLRMRIGYETGRYEGL